jgi:hypothetical protein
MAVESAKALSAAIVVKAVIYLNESIFIDCIFI